MKNLLLLLSAAAVLSGCHNTDVLKITVSNKLDIDRSSETVEIPYARVIEKIPDVMPGQLIVTDKKGNEVTSQLIFEGNESPVAVIFQPVVAGNSSSVYYIKKGTPIQYETKAYGRFVPERMDDYAWENDRIAFRIYGTALIAKDGPSNGLDVWVKRTDKMVIDKWYSEYLAGKNSYHDDNGEGCDCFKVGRTLGAGAMAPYVKDSLWLGINFEAHKTLDNGPLRTSFRLYYPPFLVDSIMVTETRTISLDAGSQLTRITEEYSGFDNVFTVAAGIVKRVEGKVIVTSPEANGICYRLDGGESGITFIGTILTTDPEGITETGDHLLIKTRYVPGEKLVYYTGAGWSKWGFENEDLWRTYLGEFMLKLNSPLQVNID